MAAEETHFPGAPPGPRSSDLTEPDDDDEDREVEGLEREVKEIAEKILHYRSTVPLHAVEALQSSLAAQRPVLCGDPDLGLERASGGGGRRCEDGEQAEPSRETSISETDQEMIEKIQLFRRKTSKVIEVFPVVLKRMNDCIARIDRVCQHNVNVHPVFKKQRKL